MNERLAYIVTFLLRFETKLVMFLLFVFVG